MLKYPKKSIRRPVRGLNLNDNKFDVRADEAFKLRNSLWIKGSLIQRGGFEAYSSTDFNSFGRFRGAHDYHAPGGSARLLFYTNSGVIKEWLTSSTEADRVTGLASSVEGYFATVYDAVVFCNGSSAPRIGRGTAWRQFGSPAPVTDLAVSPSGSGSITGTYLHIVVPVIEVGGVSVVFADWSNIVKTTASSDAQFDVTWTDIVDSRITAYLYFRTEASGTDLRSVARIATGVGAYTDTNLDTALPVTVTGAPSRPSPLNSWGVPSVGALVAFSGERCFVGNISGYENAAHASRKAGNAYEAEGFPDIDSDFSTLIRLPGNGNLTAMIPLGNRGGGRSEDLLLSQPSSMYILPESDPDLPIEIISPSIGLISSRAFAKDGTFLFFQSRRGVEFWPGVGRDTFLLSDKIQPIFEGGGNQSLTQNQNDDDIRYCISQNQLWITVRDDASATGANKVYCMDLQFFRQNFNPLNPSDSARFTGPIDNTGLGFGILLNRVDGSLINFDSQNSRILKYNKTADQDSVDAVDTNIPVDWWLGPILKEEPGLEKVLHHGRIYAFTNTQLTVTMISEFEKVVSTALVSPVQSALEWDDITWEDITWLYDTWYQDVAFEFEELVGKWFYPKISKSDSESGCALFGDEYYFSALDHIRAFP